MGGGLKKRTGLEKKGGGVEKKWIPKMVVDFQGSYKWRCLTPINGQQ